jgi:hypothetical protein
MKNLLNNLSQSEKNRILEQYNNSLLVDTSKFKKLLESKLGDVKPLMEKKENLILLNEETNGFNGEFYCAKKIGKPKPSESYSGRFYIESSVPGFLDFTLYDNGLYYRTMYKSRIPSDKNIFYTYSCSPKGEIIYTENESSMVTPKTKVGSYTANKITQQSTTSKTPFKNNTEGDEFRQWVNKNYKDIATSLLDLDPIGKFPDSYYNPTIQKAWKHKVGNSTLGEIFMMQKIKKGFGFDFMDKISTDPIYNNLDNLRKQYTKNTESEFDPFGFNAIEKRDIELKPASSFPQVFKGSGGERLNKEVFYIKSRSQYKGKPFFVIDPRMKIVAAFDSGHNLVKMSQTVEGKDTQRTVPLTYEEWCKAAKGQFINKKCSVDLSKNYYVLAQIHAQASSPGIYKGSGTRYEPAYTGKQNVPNILNIKTLKGVSLPMAIHALVPIKNRIEADATLKKYLNTEKELGRIPETYTKLVNGLISSKTFDLSSGCFNVDPDFINDPKVLSIANSDPYIFVMSEQEDYYLVQVEPKKGPEFFQKLGGDGDFCKSPSTIGVEVGGQEIKTV